MSTSYLLWALLAPTSPTAQPISAPAAAPIVQEAEAAGPKWSGSVTVGATYSSGNTDRTSIAAGVDAERRAEKDRYTSKSWWNYTKEDRVRTENKLGTNLKYDYFAREKLYYLGIAGAEKDDQASLDLRYYAGAGAGYQFREDDEVKLLGELALIYFAEEFDDGTDDDSVALRGAYNYGNQLTETTHFGQSFEIFPAIDDFDDYYLKLDSRLKANLTDNMFAQIQHVLDYDNTPADVPGIRKADNRVILSVGWSF
jgi:putative salt-induced outer membrane protein YdiY